MSVRTIRNRFEESARQQKDFQVRVGVPLLAVVSAFAFGIALSESVLPIIPGAFAAWWFYPLLLLVVTSGVAAPLVREAWEINLGRFLLGGAWLVVPALIGSISAMMQGGWEVDRLMIQGIVPGVLFLFSFVMATSLGDGCVLLTDEGEDENATQMEMSARRGTNGAKQLAKSSFTSWVLLAFVGTARTESLLGMQEASGLGWAPLIAAAVGVMATLGMLHMAHVHNLRRTWAAQGDDQLVMLGQARWREAAPLVGIVAFFAWLLPSNISPVAHLGFRGFFVRLNELVAPWFVAGQRSGGSGSSTGFLGRLAELIIPRVEGDGGEAGAYILGTLGNAVMLLLIILATAVVIWRIVRLLRTRGAEPSEGPSYQDRGILIEFILWLWGQIRAMFSAVSSWADGLVGQQGAESLGKRKRARKRRMSREDDEAGGPAVRIRKLFARMLMQLGRMGYPREKTETPFEYAGRVAQVRPDAQNELEETTRIYVKARYSPDMEPTGLERAFEALKHSIGRLIEVIRRKSANPQ